jgi:allantoinase
LQAFLSSQVVTPQGIRAGAVLVEDARIVAVVESAAVPADAVREDFGNAVLLPGLVDSHVHINEPGRTDWEGFQTATRAAAAGGYTMLVDMPLNCIPSTTTVAALEAKRKAAHGQCWIDWAAWGGLVPDNYGCLAELARAGVAGFKCFLVHPGIDEFAMVGEKELRQALPALAKTGLPLLVHAEVPGPIAAATAQLNDADWSSYRTYLESRPDRAEREAIDLMLSLCREYSLKLHIVHLATGSALEMLSNARSQGITVSIETCPHYLCLEAEGIAKGATECKCAPPIRSHANRAHLWRGLREGVIDMVVTDHSPCPPAMKRRIEGDFRNAWGGIASLSVALPVMWTEARQRGFSLEDIVRWMAERPAKLAGCDSRKGRLAAGHDADMIVFDPDKEFTVTPDRLHQRHKVSPYLGVKLCGVVRRTYLRGQMVYQRGEFVGEPAGREVRRDVTN